MSHPTLEVADIFRRYGEAWRARNAAHLSLGQRRVMTAIEICRTAALGGHVERCDDCAHARIAYHNKAKVYGLLFATVAETLTTIAADPKHLGADIGVISVLHTWGQQLDHHPHIHCIVPGGGLSPEGDRWIASRRNFLVSVKVLSALFRRLFLTGLTKLQAAGELQFFGDYVALADAAAFKTYIARAANKKWVVFAKRPFAGPKQVLTYLARYTHRVAISNRRLIEIAGDHVSFRWKDYREDGSARSKVMRLTPGEFMRRFLLHVLPDGFHRIRHHGLFANGHRAEKLALCRKLLGVKTEAPINGNGEIDVGVSEPEEPPPCPCCGGRMRIIETFERGTMPRSGVIVMRFDTS